jgi:hypothetical protein
MKHFFHVTLKNKVTDERRKFRRYKCLLPAEVLKTEGKDKFIERTSVHDFSSGGLKLIINFITPDPGSDMELKLYVPEKGLKASLKAEMAWKKFADDKLEVGLKIKEMNKNLKSEILNWVFPNGWKEREERKSRSIF